MQLTYFFLFSSFRHRVLHLTQCDALSLMMKLQSLFAFLERSQVSCLFMTPVMLRFKSLD